LCHKNERIVFARRNKNAHYIKISLYYQPKMTLCQRYRKRYMWHSSLLGVTITSRDNWQGQRNYSIIIYTQPSHITIKSLLLLYTTEKLIIGEVSDKLYVTTWIFRTFLRFQCLIILSYITEKFLRIFFIYSVFSIVQFVQDPRFSK